MVHWEETWHKVKNMCFNDAIDRKSLLPFCFWSLWLTRNNNVFDKKKNLTPVKQTIARATEYYHIVVYHMDKGESTAIHIKWEPPPNGSYELNTDGAACHKIRVGGVGGVFKNNMGDWVLGYIRGLPYTTSIEAELHALWSLMEQLWNPTLEHNFRELNQVADLLATEGAARKLFGRTEVLAVPPVFVNKALWAEILGTVFVRNIRANPIVMQNNDNATHESSGSQTMV
ncbi:uncharacterized protein [Nicotiana tomentosiformis]|uniref:uncharacterized protein n=1 Tax=Nicotiana tomentosiformis TaxID=4098 RepID=UPI00051C40C2|nr:uncharacterized protein LOC117275626 [Nicotiana tomentosiformis]